MYLQDHFKDALLIIAPEGRQSAQQNVQHDSQAPHVSLHAVISSQHLQVQCSSRGLSKDQRWLQKAQRGLARNSGTDLWRHIVAGPHNGLHSVPWSPVDTCHFQPGMNHAHGSNSPIKSLLLVCDVSHVEALTSMLTGQSRTISALRPWSCQ